MTINVSTGFEFVPASVRGGERREHGGVQVGVPPPPVAAGGGSQIDRYGAVAWIFLSYCLGFNDEPSKLLRFLYL